MSRNSPGPSAWPGLPLGAIAGYAERRHGDQHHVAIVAQLLAAFVSISARVAVANLRPGGAGDSW